MCNSVSLSRARGGEGLFCGEAEAAAAVKNAENLKNALFRVFKTLNISLLKSDKTIGKS